MTKAEAVPNGRDTTPKNVVNPVFTVQNAGKKLPKKFAPNREHKHVSLDKKVFMYLVRRTQPFHVLGGIFEMSLANAVFVVAS